MKVVLNLKPPPRVINWRTVGPPLSSDHGLFVLLDRPFCYLSKSQRLALISNSH